MLIQHTILLLTTAFTLVSAETVTYKDCGKIVETICSHPDQCSLQQRKKAFSHILLTSYRLQTHSRFSQRATVQTDTVCSEERELLYDTHRVPSKRDCWTSWRRCSPTCQVGNTFPCRTGKSADLWRRQTELSTSNRVIIHIQQRAIPLFLVSA
ncbi:hypothetical protein T265_14812, partial [Opisthorchis viverrini]